MKISQLPSTKPGARRYRFAAPACVGITAAFISVSCFAQAIPWTVQVAVPPPAQAITPPSSCNVPEQARRSLARDANGDILVVSCESASVLPGLAFSEPVITVAKLDGASGQSKWRQTYTVTGRIVLSRADNQLVLASNGDVFVAARFDGVEEEELQLFRLDGISGDLIWQASGPAFIAGDLDVQADGNLLLSNFRTLGGDGGGLQISATTGVVIPATASPVLPNGGGAPLTIGNTMYAAGTTQNGTVRTVIKTNSDITPPGAPTSVSAIGGNGKVTLSFLPPPSDGGLPITTYVAACGIHHVTGTGSPLVVAGLTNGTTYSCSVQAINAAYGGPASAPILVTPTLPPLTLQGIFSRKTHGAAGAYELPLRRVPAVTGNISIEPRTSAAAHEIVFKFNVQIESLSTVSVVNGNGVAVGTVSAAPLGNDVVVRLADLADGSRVLVSIGGVNGTLDVATAIGFLVGDVNESGAIDRDDVASIKARAGQPVDPVNFRLDVNASGVVNVADVLVGKRRIGSTLN